MDRPITRTQIEQDTEPNPTLPHPALRHLDVFVGNWTTEGEIDQDNPAPAGAPAPGSKVTGTDSYHWFPGGHFLLHRWTWDVGGIAFEGLSVMGYDEETGSYPMHNFDNLGYTRIYQAKVQDRRWTYSGASERATVAISEDGDTITYTWERRPDGSTWKPLCEVRTSRK